MNQLSIYAENKQGMFQIITNTLEQEGINILGSVTNDSAEYGIIRMVVSDTEKAYEALTKEGFLCRTTPVLGVEIFDEVGALNRLLSYLRDCNINVDYLYLSFNRDSGMPIIVLHTEDVPEVKNCLEAKGFCVL